MDLFSNYALLIRELFSVRDRLIERWKDTELFFDKKGVKRVYYLSLEFLMGRSLTNALSNLQLDESFKRFVFSPFSFFFGIDFLFSDQIRRALRDLGIKMEELSEAVLLASSCLALRLLPVCGCLGDRCRSW